MDDYPAKMPGFAIHDLEKLLILSGRGKFIASNHKATWEVATKSWKPEMRYRAINTITSVDAQTMINETTNLLPFL